MCYIQLQTNEKTLLLVREEVKIQPAFEIFSGFDSFICSVDLHPVTYGALCKANAVESMSVTE